MKFKKDSGNKMNLIRKKADWALKNLDYKLAVDLLNSIEEYEKSIQIMKDYHLKNLYVLTASTV